MTTVSSSALRKALFEPATIGVIGASNDTAKTAGRPLAFLRKHGFAGAVYPVNPGREIVQGEKAYASIADLPPVDHAFIVLPTELVLGAVEDCARHGVKAATILAAGFAEAGAEGIERQRRLQRLAAETGCRILGPNSLGLVRTANNLMLTANAAFAGEPPIRGRYSVLSQSGSLIGTFCSRGRPRGIGFANLVSVGNEADLSLGEIGEALADDGDTDAFLLFLETIRRPDMLERFAAAAHRAGKPILAYKLGRSKIGSELAVSHTGALVGSDAAADCFLRQLGILRVDQFETLIEAAPLAVAAAQQRHAPRVATIVTTTGGGGAMVADRLGLHGIEVRGMNASTRSRLAAKGIAIADTPIIDVTMAGVQYATMRAILDELLQDGSAGAVIAVTGSSAELLPERVVSPIIDAVRAAGETGPPVAVFTVPHAPAASRMLREAGIAAFNTPEACADAVRAVLVRSVPKRARDALPAIDDTPFRNLPPHLNEDEALAVFERLAIPIAARVVLPVAALEDAAALRLPPFPVVAKLLSRRLPHKTEAGAVSLGITSIDELKAAVSRMLQSVKRYAPNAVIDGVLVQQQCQAVGEVLLGLHRDPNVGPVVTLGLGGTFAEIYKDVAVRLAPLDHDEALAMIGEVRGFSILKGYRNRPAGDLAALADAVVRLSHLATVAGIKEAEINPLLVHAAGQGVTAVDGLLVCD